MSEYMIICLFVFITGAVIGSFLNVVALRAITKESIVLPPSKCPQCSEPIKWFDNIPIFSYFFTFKGHCRHCGCKVSIQYPIVEAVTAILFLTVFLTFGATLQTLMLLILLSMAIVLIITDIKKEYLFDNHLWIFIIAAIVYSTFFKYGVENIFQVFIGALAGVIIMELIARGAYYLVKKNSDKSIEQTQENEKVNEENITEENFDINEYVKKYKRVFGEGDTYLAAASGALLGWKYFILAVFAAIIIQALCIIPQFFKGLYEKKEYKLIFSLSAFAVIALIYWILSNIFTLNLYLIFAFVIALTYFAIKSITGLKQSTNEQGYKAIPFGPALLIATFTILFFGNSIALLLKKYIFFLN